MTRIFTALALIVGFALPAAAQPPDWTLQVKLGKPIFLTTDAGERVEGIAGQVTPEAIVVSTPVGIRSVSYRELRRAQKRDGVSNGVGIGIGIGVALGLSVVLPADCHGARCADESVGFLIGSGLYGALIGWGIDSLFKGRTTIFETDVTSSVALTPRRGGIAASLTFGW